MMERQSDKLHFVCHFKFNQVQNFALLLHNIIFTKLSTNCFCYLSVINMFSDVAMTFKISLVKIFLFNLMITFTELYSSLPVLVTIIQCHGHSDVCGRT